MDHLIHTTLLKMGITGGKTETERDYVAIFWLSVLQLDMAEPRCLSSLPRTINHHVLSGSQLH